MSYFSHPGNTFRYPFGDRGAPAAAVAGPYGSCLVNMAQENPLQFHGFFPAFNTIDSGFSRVGG